MRFRSLFAFSSNNRTYNLVYVSPFSNDSKRHFYRHTMLIIEHYRYIWVLYIETMTAELRLEPCKSNVY